MNHQVPGHLLSCSRWRPLGVLLGRSLVLGAPDAARFTPANEGTLGLWAALVGVVCGYALAALVVMTRWAWQVLKIFRPGIPPGSVVKWILAILLTLSVVALVTHGIPAGTLNGRPVHLFSHQIVGFTIAGGICTIPGLVGFLALRSLARNDSQWDEKPKCQILMAIHLRQHLRRLLGTFGLFLALYVVVTATRRQLVLGFYKDAIYPQNYALLIGLLLAAVLALFHVSATMAINWRCERLLDEYAPIPSPRTYYSRCFPACDRVAAQRGSWLRRGGYVVSPPSGRRGSGGEGCQAGAVVVPAGAGLVAPPPC